MPVPVACDGKRRAVFLDRDGVLNRAVVVKGKPYPPADRAALEVLPGAEEACLVLKRAGALLICVTNQPDIARGAADVAEVEAINGHLQTLLSLDEVLVCPHDDADGCACRKPLPGLLLEAAREHGVDLKASVMVGDRWRDIAAGKAAGCKTVFLDYGYDEARPDCPDFTFGSLHQAVPTILRMLGGRNSDMLPLGYRL